METLLNQLRQAEAVTPALAARVFASDTPLWQIAGMLLRQVEELERAMMGADLVTEAGRMEALRAQGVAKGARMLLESLLAIVTEERKADVVE